MLNKLLKLRNSKKGFTLVELIVVIAILGILALIAIPNLGSFRKTAAEKADDATANVINKVIQTGIASKDITLPSTDNQKYFDFSGSSIDSTHTAENNWITEHLGSDLKLQYYTNVRFLLKANGNTEIAPTPPPSSSN